MRRQRSLFLLLCCAGLTLACTLAGQAVPTPTAALPSTLAPSATLPPATYTLAPTPIPSATLPPPTLSPSQTPLSLAALATATPEQAQGLTPTMGDENGAIVQIGIEALKFLRYDPAVWEPVEGGVRSTDTGPGEGSTFFTLQHRQISGCILRENVGRGAPETWRRKDSEKQIGGQRFELTSFIEIATGNPVLVVYQYAPDGQYGPRYELLVKSEPQRCLESAEAVLVLSADLYIQR